MEPITLVGTRRACIIVATSKSVPTKPSNGFIVKQAIEAGK
jgi:S-adenosylmethionine hydrolase